MNKMISTNPATNDIIWEGSVTSPQEIHHKITQSQIAFLNWSKKTFAQRHQYLQSFIETLTQNREEFENIISKETGKMSWEAKSEVDSMINKLPLSVEAYQERCKELEIKMPNGVAKLYHKPHGVVCVLGPFNFPGHLPNGHIIPALLAGNTVVFKPSPLTPWVGEVMHQFWEKSGLPEGVLQLIQGGAEEGKFLSSHSELSGLMFTGSYPVGQTLAKQFANHPEKILALEMGGNNPLLIDFSDELLLDAAVYLTIQSAYITTGQRCTCARHLILIDNKINKLFFEKLMVAIQKIKVGSYLDTPEPFMGPLISRDAAHRVLNRYNTRCAKGATIYIPMTQMGHTEAFLSPGLIDVTNSADIEDEEIFGPLLQVTWVKDFASGIKVANNTTYGLAAGLFSNDKSKYVQFLNSIETGLINWNRPLTGASSRLPFGGIKHSGNHRPSAWYAADYCAYPVASMEEENLTLPSTFMPGITL